MIVVGIDELHFGEDGLIPVVVQDVASKEVLMLAFMNREALEVTIATGKVTFWSRSRNKLWTKGETSGNYLELYWIKANCEDNSLLVSAKPEGATCHTGRISCFRGREFYSAWTDEPNNHCGSFKRGFGR